MSVFLRIDGLQLGGPNAKRGATIGAARAHARHTLIVKGAVSVRLAAAWRRAGKPVVESVTITRIGPGRLDADNVVAACKATIDGIAYAIGVNDKRFVLHLLDRLEVKDAIPLRIAQRREGAKLYAVEITLNPAGD